MKHSVKIPFFIGMLLLMVLISTAQNTTANTLKEYQHIQEDNRNQRYFRYEDGAPKKGEDGSYYSYTDETGYLWVETREPFSIHRFNGTIFTDMAKSFPANERDSLLNVSQTANKSIHLVGKHFLYRWEGHKFTKFAYPKDDAITTSAHISNNVLCIGAKGYAILDAKSWRFIRIDMATDQKKYDTITITASAGSKVRYPFTQIDYNLGGNNILYRYVIEGMMSYDSNTGESTILPMLLKKDYTLECFSAQGKYYIPVLSREELEKLYNKGTIILPQTFRIANGDLYLYFYNTNLLYRIDEDKRRAVPEHFPEGTMLKVPLKATTNVNLNQQDYISYYYQGYLEVKPFRGITGSNYKPARLPTSKPELDYNTHIQLGEDVFSTSPLRADDNWSISKAFRVNPGYDEFIPVDLPEIMPIKDTRNPYYSKGKYLVYSTPDKVIPQVHHVYVLDFIRPPRKYSVVDPAPYLVVLDYNAQSDLVMLAGKEQIITLSMQQPTRQIYSFDDLENSDPTMKAGNYIVNTPSTYHQIVYRQNEGKVEKLLDLDDTYSVEFDHKLGLMYYLFTKDSKTSLLSYNLKTGKTQIRSPKLDIITGVFFPGNAVLVQSDFTYTRFQNDHPTSGALTALKAKLDSLLTGAGIDPRLVLNWSKPEMISEDELFFGHNTYSVEDNNGEIILNQAVSYSDDGYTEPFPKAFAYIKGEKPQIEIPSFTYNLNTNELIERPNWYRTASTISNNLKERTSHIIYIQTADGKPQLRCSKYENGKLTERYQDWILPIAKDRIPPVHYYRHYDDQCFQIANRLYYMFKHKWYYLNTTPYQQYGELQSVTPLRDDLWLCYNNVVIRVSKQTQQGFMFTSKYGVPDNLKKLYLDAGKMYILAKSGVYSFNPDEGNATLLLPWLQANNTRFNNARPVKLKHKQNNIIIPVDILHTLFPERIRLSYRLVGYEEDWKERDYNPQIEYPRLPPGRYEFQIKATSPTGKTSKPMSLFFTITPPFYANIFAYLFYLVVLFLLGRHLYLLRVKQLQARNLALENTVALRTSELQESLKLIQDSIAYASLIQKSILPQAADLASTFREYFVIWRPRAVVGGDFYWMLNTDSGDTYFAIIDCTGHGVPGALLSMTVNSLLYNMIRDKGLSSPAAILSTMHLEMGAALHQESEHSQQDGLEIAILKINKAKGSLIFAGAGLHLLHYSINTRSLVQIKGDRHGLGSLKWHKELSFTEHELAYEPHQRLYLYTDGIIDQPVPRRDKAMRLGSAEFMNWVNSFAEYALDEQRIQVEARLATMLEYHEQRDDITLIGLSIV